MLANLSRDEVLHSLESTPRNGVAADPKDEIISKIYKNFQMYPSDGDIYSNLIRMIIKEGPQLSTKFSAILEVVSQVFVFGQFPRDLYCSNWIHRGMVDGQNGL